MAKSKKENPAINCACTKCDVKARAIPGTQHRRCKGASGQGIHEKRGTRTHDRAGRWEPARD